MKSILLIFLVLLSGKTLFAGNDEDMITIMTYNIRVAFDTGENSWDNRKEMVASTIKKYNADILGLQEVLKKQLDDLLNLLPEYSYVGVGRDDGKDEGEYSPILYRKDRFEILSDSTIWLSETPEVPSVGWDAALKRIITWAKIIDKNTSKIFYHFNTHFDHKGEMARLESANLLNDKVAEIAGKTPAFATGDLNFTPDSKAYQILIGGRRNYLFDTQKSAEEDDSGENVSFNGFQEELKPGNKIDYIFTKNDIEVLKHKIIYDKINGRFPSDHMPVIAEVRIK